MSFAVVRSLAVPVCAERLHRTTLLTQADGEKLRYGRLDAAWDGRLQLSGALHKRGQVATWSWRPGFFVLCEGLLHEFGDASLTSPLVGAWPVLGALVGRAAVSHRQHAHALQITVHPYYIGDSLLASTELAAPSEEAAAMWVAALERASLGVSKHFKDAHRAADVSAYPEPHDRADVRAHGRTSRGESRAGRRSPHATGAAPAAPRATRGEAAPHRRTSTPVKAKHRETRANASHSPTSARSASRKVQFR